MYLFFLRCICEWYGRVRLCGCLQCQSRSKEPATTVTSIAEKGKGARLCHCERRGSERERCSPEIYQQVNAKCFFIFISFL